MELKENILEVNNLSVTFRNGKDVTYAVQDVTFNVRKGEILGIVGESGSGKSVTAMSIMQLVDCPPGRIDTGTIVYNGENLLEKSEVDMVSIRGNEIAMIFQEPMTSFNPLFTIGYQIEEAIMLHQNKSKKEAKKLAVQLLSEVGIPSSEKRAEEYPHQMSGGMIQRAMIAMALSCNPKLLIADEPTTALDVTIQAQILDLIKRLQQERGMAIMLITHDLGVVAEVAESVIVMYAGRIVEEADVNILFEKPLHPYTIGLINSIPRIGKRTRLPMIPLKGNANEMREGCRFQPRCAYATEICLEKEPPLQEKANGRKVRCWISINENVGENETNG